MILHHYVVLTDHSKHDLMATSSSAAIMTGLELAPAGSQLLRCYREVEWDLEPPYCNSTFLF